MKTRTPELRPFSAAWLRPLLLLLLATVLATATACSASSLIPGNGGGDTVDKGGVDASYENAAPTSSVARKVIGTATAALESADVKDAAARLTAAAEALGGYVSSSSLVELSDGRFRAQLTLKVPAAKLTGLLDALSDYGKVVSTSTATEDVTDAYYDAQARLRNALAQETRLLEIMESATTIQDTLLVRAELDKVQATVEQLKGQIRLWDALVDMATLTLSIAPEATMVTGNPVFRVITGSELWKGISNAFLGSVAFVANALGYLLMGLSAVLVPVAVVLAAVWGVVLLVRARRRARAKKQVARPSGSAAPPAGPAA